MAAVQYRESVVLAFGYSVENIGYMAVVVVVVVPHVVEINVVISKTYYLLCGFFKMPISGHFGRF